MNEQHQGLRNDFLRGARAGFSAKLGAKCPPFAGQQEAPATGAYAKGWEQGQAALLLLCRSAFKYADEVLARAVEVIEVRP